MEQAVEQGSAFIPITTTYGSILALMLVALALWVSLGRAKTGLSMGDGGDEMMQKRTRAFGNFVEYVPMAVIVMLLIENASGRDAILHTMGIALIVGRIAHVIGIHPARPLAVGRVIGAGLTWLVVGLGALYALKLVLPGI